MEVEEKILAQVELNLYTLGKYDDTLDFSSTLTGNSFAALCAMMIKKANSKAPSYIYLHLTWKAVYQHYNICLDVLKSTNLLHKWDLGDS